MASSLYRQPAAGQSKSASHASGAPGTGGAGVGGSGSTPQSDNQSLGGSIRGIAEKDESASKSGTPRSTGGEKAWTPGFTRETKAVSQATKTGTTPSAGSGTGGKIAN